MRVAYRARQALQRLFAARRHGETEAAEQLLSPPALALYRQMSPGDRWHGQQVLDALRAAGDWDAAVQQAALLHDVGKAHAGLTLVHRTLVVLMQAGAPGLLQRLAGDGTPAWRRPFHVQVHHAGIGAEMCARAGCSSVTVALVRAHQGAERAALPPELRAAAVALEQADDRS